MASVLRDNGHLIVRAFCPPEPHLSPKDVVRKAENRELSNFHEFKLLLLAALQQGKACTGVELASVWRSFHAHFPDVNQCAQATAWPVNTRRTIDLYKNSSTCNCFPNAAAVLSQALNPRTAYKGPLRTKRPLCSKAPGLLQAVYANRLSWRNKPSRSKPRYSHKAMDEALGPRTSALIFAMPSFSKTNGMVHALTSLDTPCRQNALSPRTRFDVEIPVRGLARIDVKPINRPPSRV